MENYYIVPRQLDIINTTICWDNYKDFDIMNIPLEIYGIKWWRDNVIVAVDEFNGNNWKRIATLEEWLKHANEIVAGENTVLNGRDTPLEITKAVDPPHYQGYLKDLQWIEAMQYIPTFRDSEHFESALELQVRKYLDRSGQKDDVLQELSKALWYLKFLVAYRKAGRNIKVEEIDKILAE
jgi:hypothetical protein